MFDQIFAHCGSDKLPYKNNHSLNAISVSQSIVMNNYKPSTWEVHLGDSEFKARHGK